MEKILIPRGFLVSHCEYKNFRIVINGEHQEGYCRLCHCDMCLVDNKLFHISTYHTMYPGYHRVIEDF